MAGVRLEFAQFGHFDYFKIYRNSVSTAIENLGEPIGSSSTMYYEDLTVESNQDYYYRAGVVRGGVEKISNEYLVETNTSLWNSTIVLMQNISDAANDYHTFEGSSTRSNLGASLGDTYKWLGGVLAPNGKIYCVPRNAADILIIDPSTNTATRSNMGVSLTGSEKWLGGVLAANGKIYCAPVNATDILIIDPSTDTATRSNLGASLSGTGKWYGGVLAANGKIYCVPNNATDILIIDKNPSVPALDIKDCLSPHLNKF